MVRRILLCLIFIFSPFTVAASSVVINEVMFDPLSTDTGLEWVEIYNAGGKDEDLSGWQLYADDAGYFSFPSGLRMGPKQFIVIHLRASGVNSASELWQGPALGNMGNTSGSAALFSGEPRGKETIRSFVRWSGGGTERKTWESAASEAGLWTKGGLVDISSAGEEKSIALLNDGVASISASSWRAGAVPTQGISNTGSSIPPEVSSDSESSTPTIHMDSQSQVVVSLSPSSFNVYAGDDRTVIAGVSVEFIGRAGDRDGGSLSLARYLWNFGDGATFDGKIANHVFRVPGTYLLGLAVSSGETAVSDYARIRVVPNPIRVSGVIEGKEGFVRLANPSDTDIDIGEWILKDKTGKQFAIPTNTKIASRSEAGFANALTGLFSAAGMLPLIVLYHTNEEAFRYESEKKDVQKPKDTEMDPVKIEKSSVGLVRSVSSPAEVVKDPLNEKAMNLSKSFEKGKSVSGGYLLFLLLAAGVSIAASIGFLVVRIFFL